MEDHEKPNKQIKKWVETSNIYTWAAILGLLAAIFLTFNPEFGRGNFLHGILGVCGAAIAFGAYVLGRTIVHFKVFHCLARIFTAIAILLSFVFLSVFTGNMVLDHDIKKAKRFCEDLVPLLDAYQKANGEYPGGLNKIPPKDKKPPRIVRGDSFYYSREGDSFSFSFSDPGGMMNGWGYSGKHKEWYEWD